MTEWLGIEGVEATDLRFFSEAPELLWRGGSVTHVPEVVLLLRSTSIAVVPAVRRWLDTIKNNTSVEMISIVGLTLFGSWTVSSLHERDSGVLGRVFLSISETIWMFLWFLVTTIIRKVSDVKSMIIIPILFHILSNHFLSIRRNLLRWVRSLFNFILIVIVFFHVSMFVLVSVVQTHSSDLLNGDHT